MTGPRLIDLGNPVADHPLNRGRVQWLLPVPQWAAGLTWQDLGKRYPGTLAGGCGWDAERVAISANAHRVESAPSSNGSASWSLQVDAVVLPATADSGAVFGRAYNSAEGFAYYRTATGRLDYYEGGSLRFSTATGSVPTGTRLRLLLTRAGTAATVYADGVAVGSGSISPGGAVALTGNPMRVGQDTGGSNAARLQVYGVSVWDRALSAAEAAAESDQARRGYPDLLRRYTPKFYLPAAPSGPAPLESFDTLSGSEPWTGDLEWGDGSGGVSTPTVTRSSGHVTQGTHSWRVQNAFGYALLAAGDIYSSSAVDLTGASEVAVDVTSASLGADSHLTLIVTDGVDGQIVTSANGFTGSTTLAADLTGVTLDPGTTYVAFGVGFNSDATGAVDTFWDNLRVTAAPPAQDVTATGLGSTAAFGTAALTPGVVTITGTGIAPATAFGSASVAPGAVSISATALSPTAAFGSATALSTATISGTGIGPTATFGSATVTPGAVTITATGLAGTEAFGSAALTQGSTIAATGIASGEAFGSATVAPGAVSITVTGLASTEAFGSAVVGSGGSLIAATGLASTEAFGSPTLSPGSVTVAATGIPATTAFGSAAVAATYSVTASGIAGTSALGSPTLIALVQAVGIASGEAFGSPAVAPTYTISATGIAGTASLGSAALAATNAVTVASIDPGTAFGSGTVTPGAAAVAATGLPSGAAAGTPSLFTPAPPAGARTCRVRAEARTRAVPAEPRTLTAA